MTQRGQNEKLRVLILSCSALDKSNSAGSTFSNFFHGMENVELASLYLGYGEPNNDLDMRYFQVTEKSLLKNLLNKSFPSGRRVIVGSGAAVGMNKNEKKSFDFMRTARLQIFFWMRELIWRIGRVHSKELQSFVSEFAPDVALVSMNDTCYLDRESVKISRKMGVPVCAFIGDDIYSLRRIKLSPLFWIDRLIKRASHRRLIKRCRRLFVMTDTAKAEFDRVFGVDCALITKSLDFSGEPAYKNEDRDNKLRFVYTGNLYANRWRSLAELGSALSRLNEEYRDKGGPAAELLIYSMTPMTSGMKKALSTPAVKLMGGVPASDIPEIQKGADILVHAESTLRRNMLVVRLSFSTKLVDYMHAARCILAIGSSEQASIAHLVRHDAALTVTEKDDMYVQVKRLYDDPELLREYAAKAWHCGAEQHQKELMQGRLFSELTKAAQGD